MPSAIQNTILYLENFPIENAGYQYRAAKWAELLRKEGYQVYIWTLWEDKAEFERRVNRKPFSRFLTSVLIKRFKQVLASRRYETVIVRRELLMYNDYGNLFLDKLLLQIHPNAILDFDDDRRRKNYSNASRSLYGRLLLENRDKFYSSLKLYRRFIVATSYLESLVHQVNTQVIKDVLVMPTCIDYDGKIIRNYDLNNEIDRIQIGWIGSNGNLNYLDSIISELNIVHKYQPIELKVISGKIYENVNATFPIINVDWKLDNEISEMLTFDIGIMPLNLDRVSKGKGGFKLIQYMGIGIISVASAVTINEEIIEDGVNGFLVRENQSWSDVLIKVIDKRSIFEAISLAAKHTINSRYTFHSNTSKYIKFLESEINQ